MTALVKQIICVFKFGAVDGVAWKCEPKCQYKLECEIAVAALKECARNAQEPGL